MQRNLCIELPEEDLEEHEKGQDLVGHLNQSLYGTRDAAANFQKEVNGFTKKIGFQVGKYNPCTYYNRNQDRADIQFATKEVCRGMCHPTKGDVIRLRRLVL